MAFAVLIAWCVIYFGVFSAIMEEVHHYYESHPTADPNRAEGWRCIFFYLKKIQKKSKFFSLNSFFFAHSREILRENFKIFRENFKILREILKFLEKILKFLEKF